MSLFGSSYPPGCSGTPFDASDGPCEICGDEAGSCKCPECPGCGTAGDPECYGKAGHMPGLSLTAMEVGNVVGTDEHFIAVRVGRAENIVSPLSGKTLASVRFIRDDIPWLIEALQRELAKSDCCEHAMTLGSWCEACNKEYKAAEA